MVREGSIPDPLQGLRDATGERSISLAKIVLYNSTHLASYLYGVRWVEDLLQ
jgi:hypothetical protein